MKFLIQNFKSPKVILTVIGLTAIIVSSVMIVGYGSYLRTSISPPTASESEQKSGTILPQTSTPPCTQKVKVIDQDGNPIESAVVSFITTDTTTMYYFGSPDGLAINQGVHSWTIGSFLTDANGNATINFPTKGGFTGGEFIADAWAPDYEDHDNPIERQKKFTVCASEITLKLTKKSVISTSLPDAVIAIGPWGTGDIMAKNIWHPAKNKLEEMGYSVDVLIRPQKEELKKYISSNKTSILALFGDGHQSCVQVGVGGSAVSANDVKEWIKNYSKMPFTFFHSCSSVKSSDPGTLNYELRKGEITGTVAIGLKSVGSGSPGKWIPALFDLLSQGKTVGEIFDRDPMDKLGGVYMISTNAGFIGDGNMKLVPKLERGEGIIIPEDCAKEGEKVNRNPLMGSTDKQCCEGLVENRVSRSFSICERPENCAKEGEAPTDFDFTTGKINPNGKKCCEGLKAIGPKTSEESLNQGICAHVDGGPGVCRPCGDKICDSEFEDKCNCPEDCKGEQTLSADFNDDNRVGPADMAILLGSWGQDPSGSASCQSPDINKDGNVGPADFAVMMGQWNG